MVTAYHVDPQYSNQRIGPEKEVKLRLTRVDDGQEAEDCFEEEKECTAINSILDKQSQARIKEFVAEILQTCILPLSKQSVHRVSDPIYEAFRHELINATTSLSSPELAYFFDHEISAEPEFKNYEGVKMMNLILDAMIVHRDWTTLSQLLVSKLVRAATESLVLFQSEFLTMFCEILLKNADTFSSQTTVMEIVDLLELLTQSFEIKAAIDCKTVLKVVGGLMNRISECQWS